MDSTVSQDLDTARRLAELGVPLFVAKPNSKIPGEFFYPKKWEQTKPDPAVVGRWKPGMALCAVTGVLFDVIDPDPRNGGPETDEELAEFFAEIGDPPVYGEVWTPSGGTHHWIGRTGVRKDKLGDGVDLQAGADDGNGRGFVFIPPTVRPDRREGIDAVRAYGWAREPDERPARLGADSTLVRLLATKSAMGESGDGEKTFLKLSLEEMLQNGIPVGHRDDELTRLVWECVREGLSKEVAYGLWQAVTAKCENGERDFPKSVFLKKWSRAKKKYKEKPKGPVAPVYESDVAGSEIDGDQLLKDVHDTLQEYVVFPSSHAAIAVTLWIAASHAQPAWGTAPRLVAVSPEKRCGKSRLMDMVEGMCYAPFTTVNASPAALVRSIDGAEPPTMLIDETDTIFGSKTTEANEVLRGIINAGHQRNRPYVRWDMQAQAVEKCPTFAFAMLAGIRDLPDTIMDRAIVIRMRRRKPEETVADFRARRDGPALRELRNDLYVWVRAYLDNLADAAPQMPVIDRAADTWEPLIAIADLAGGNWPQLARIACDRLVAAEDAASVEESYGLKALQDMRFVFDGQPRMSTAAILEELKKLEDSPWESLPWNGRPLDATMLAKLVGPYGVKSKSIKLGSAGTDGKLRASDTKKRVLRGYHRKPIEEACERYLPPS